LKLRISLQNNTKRRGKNEVTESLRYSSFFPHLSVLSLQNLPTENLSKQLVNKIGGIDIIQNQNKTKQGEKKTERERDSTKEAKAVSKKKKKKILGKTNYR
jgi:Holliday junction resolvase-like predicted endonuclease